MSCQQMSRFLTATCTASELAATSITTPEDPYVFTDTVPTEPPTQFIAQKPRTRFADLQLSPQSIEETTAPAAAAAAAITKPTIKKLPLAQVNGNATQITTPTSKTVTATTIKQQTAAAATAKAQASSLANANGRNSPSVTVTPTSAATNFKNVTQSQLKKSFALQQQQQQQQQHHHKSRQQRSYTKTSINFEREQAFSKADDVDNHNDNHRICTLVDGFHATQYDEDDDNCFGDDREPPEDTVTAPSTGSLSSEEDDGTIIRASQVSMRLQHTPSLWQTQLLLDTSSAVVSPPTSPASLPSPTGCMQMGPMSPCIPLAAAPVTCNANLAATLPPSMFHSTTIAQHLRKVQCIKKSPKKPTTTAATNATTKVASGEDVIEIGSVVNLPYQPDGGEYAGSADDGQRAFTMLPTPSPPPPPLHLTQLEPFNSFQQLQRQQHSVSDLNEIPVNVIFRKPQTTNEITRQILAASDDCDVIAPSSLSGADTMNSCVHPSGAENVHLQKINGDGDGDIGDIQMATIPSGKAAMVNKLKNVKIIAPSIRSNVAMSSSSSSSMPPKLQPLSRRPLSLAQQTPNGVRQQQKQKFIEVDAAAAAATMPAGELSTSLCAQQPPSIQMSSNKATAKHKNGIALTNLSNNTPASSTTRAPTKPPKVAKNKLTTLADSAATNAVKKVAKKSVKVKRKNADVEDGLVNALTSNKNNNHIKSNTENTTEFKIPSPCDAPSNNNNIQKYSLTKTFLDMKSSRNALAVVKICTSNQSAADRNDDLFFLASESASLPYNVQRQWLCNAYPHTTPLGPSDTNNRENRISVYKNVLRRQALQLLATRSLQKLPIQNAQRRLMCVDRLLQKYDNQNQKEISPAKYCIATACSSVVLPMSSYCQLHMTSDESQQLFQRCSWKSLDHSECRVPVFDIEHDVPLCQKHGQEYLRVQNEATKALTYGITNGQIIQHNNNSNNNSKYPQYVQTSNVVKSISTTTTTTTTVAPAATTRKRKTTATVNTVGRKRGRKPLHAATTATTTTTTTTMKAPSTTAAARVKTTKSRKQQKQQPELLAISGGFLNTTTTTTTTAGAQPQQQHNNVTNALESIAGGNSHSSSTTEMPQYGVNSLLTPPALAPLSGLGYGMGRMLGFETDNSCANALATPTDLKEHEIQQIVTQFAMSSSFNSNTNQNNNFNNYNNSNNNCNNNNNDNTFHNNNNFNFNMIEQQHLPQHQQLPPHQHCVMNTMHHNENMNTAGGLPSPNSITAFMNTNSNSNFTSVFSSSSSLPSNDDFLSQDMLSICDNSSAYASSEDTGFGGLSETELKCGGGGGSGGGGVGVGGDEDCGIGVGGDGPHDADDITLLEEQDLANMFSALPVDSIMNELFNTVRPDERDEVERALEVVDNHLKSLQQKIGTDDSDFLGDFLDVSDQILADADMEIVSSVMHSPNPTDCMDTSGPFPDMNRNTTMDAGNNVGGGGGGGNGGWPTVNDIRGLLQT